jgi:hypothetical protein
MNCDGVRGLLSAYVDGELSAGELLRVEQHLRRCHWCADEVDALRQTIALIASLEEVEVPANFHVQLHERLAALGPPVKAARIATVHHAKRQDFRRWAVPAAAAAALVIGVTGISRYSLPARQQQPLVSQANPVSAAQPTDNPGSAQLAVTNPAPAENGKDHPAPQSPGQTNTAEPSSTATNAPEKQPVEPTTTSPAPIGNTHPSGAYTASASILTGIAEPSSLPTQKQSGAKVEASLANHSTVAAALKAHFAGMFHESTDPASGVIKLEITVPAQSLEAELAFVEAQTGAKAVPFVVDLTTELDQAYKALEELESQRVRYEEIIKTSSDKQTVANAQLALENEVKPAVEKAKTGYQKLLDQIARGSISVTLKPSKAQ